jgi:hypothetical protein
VPDHSLLEADPVSRDAGVVWTVLALYLLAALSPGPNVVLIIQTAATRPRAEAVGAALGVATGSFLLAVLGALGLRQLLAHPVVARVLHLTCAAYLVYLGIRMWYWAARLPHEPPYRHRWRQRDVSTQSDDDPDQPEGGGVLRDDPHRGHSPQHVLGWTVPDLEDSVHSGH